MPTPVEVPFPLAVPSGVTLRSRVAPLVRLRRKTSSKSPLLSFVARLLAWLVKRTRFPSALRIGKVESEFALAEGAAADGRVVMGSATTAWRSETNRSRAQSATLNEGKV